MPTDTPAAPPTADSRWPSLLSWPAWWRVLAVLPVLTLLWLAVAWARLDAAPW